MINSQIPEARKDGLVIQDMPDEILVYDLNTNKAHCLNQTAAFVWKACDGKNSIDDITRLLAQHSGDQINEDLIWLAIDQLKENDLLAAEISSKFQGESRRSIIKKIGFAAVVALPIVASLAAPTSVLAFVSCTNCTSTPQCMGAAGCPPTCTGGNCVPTPLAPPITIEIDRKLR